MKRMFSTVMAVAMVSGVCPFNPASAAAGAVSHQVIVRWANDTSAGQRHTVLDHLGLRSVRRLGGGFYLLETPADLSVAAARADLKRQDGVKVAAANVIYHTASVPNDPFFSSQGALDESGDRDIDAPEAWNSTTGSSSVVVADIDTGMDYTHPDLAPNLWTNPGEIPNNNVDDDGNGFVDDVHGWDFTRSNNDPIDTAGHGTEMSGLMGAKGNNGIGIAGVSWDVSLMQLRVGQTQGNLPLANVVSAVVYAESQGVRIINMSLNGPYSAALESAIAGGHKTLFVVAAGNSSSNDDSVPTYPCDLPEANVLCVAATDQSDQLAGFSNYGVNNVDIAAPGSGTLTTIIGGGYAGVNGTSGATAITSGVAALVAALKPTATAPYLKARIMNSVDPIPALSSDVLTGGRLNAAGAVSAVDNTAPETTIDAGPSGENDQPSFDYHSSEPDSIDFECKIDSGVFSVCSPGSTMVAALSNGSHTFYVRAIDGAGNVDPTPATVTFDVDSTAPDTYVSSRPDRINHSSGAGFTYFDPSDGAATFQCSLDQAPFTICPTSGISYNNLTEGLHNFRARSLDSANNLDPTPERFNWIVDAQQPTTTLSAAPSSPTKVQSASFTFSASEDASFECQVNGGGWRACASPKSFSGLADGQQTLRVRATDTAGNTEASPPTRTWTVDATAPQTSITSGPMTTDTGNAMFTYNADETPVTFECSLDSAPWSPCPLSGQSYSGLALGDHTFVVQATDAAGNTDATPATQSFTAVSPPPPGGGGGGNGSGGSPAPPSSSSANAPETVITKKPKVRSSSRRASFKFSGTGATSFLCRLDKGAWQSCVSPKTYRHLKAGRHSFAVQAVNAGASDLTPATATFRVLR